MLEEELSHQHALSDTDWEMIGTGTAIGFIAGMITWALVRH